jgi:hypothetical protein
MRKSSGREGLGKTVRRIWEENKTKEPWHNFVIPEVSDYLLARLHLSETQLKNARLIEAHHIRLSYVMGRHTVEGVCPTNAKTGKKIVNDALRELPAFLSRNKGRLSPRELEFAASFEEILRCNKPILDSCDDQKEIDLPIELVQFARRINQDKLKFLLGERKFLTYQKAFNNVLKKLPKR